MKQRTTINCPFCRRRMIPYDREEGGRKWFCRRCQVLFRIEQMTWVPKELLEEADDGSEYTEGQKERLEQEAEKT